MINFINTENSFNKLVRRATRGEEDISFLFLSPEYDKASMNLKRALEKKKYKLRKKVYIVDSFVTPHAFVAYNTTKVPTLVNVFDKKKTIESYLPFIYDCLGLDPH